MNSRKGHRSGLCEPRLARQGGVMLPALLAVVLVFRYGWTAVALAVPFGFALGFLQAWFLDALAARRLRGRA